MAFSLHREYVYRLYQTQVCRQHNTHGNAGLDER
jgi:hypothetical protein